MSKKNGLHCTNTQSTKCAGCLFCCIQVRYINYRKHKIHQTRYTITMFTLVVRPLNKQFNHCPLSYILHPNSLNSLNDEIKPALLKVMILGCRAIQISAKLVHANTWASVHKLSTKAVQSDPNYLVGSQPAIRPLFFSSALASSAKNVLVVFLEGYG